MASFGAKCAICGKHRVVGRSISHSGVRTRRVFKPNLHWKRITLAGREVRIKLCTKCLKRLKKDGKVASPAPQVVSTPIA